MVAIAKKARENPFLTSLKKPLDTEPTRKAMDITGAHFPKNVFFSSGVLYVSATIDLNRIPTPLPKARNICFYKLEIPKLFIVDSKITNVHPISLPMKTTVKEFEEAINMLPIALASRHLINSPLRPT